MLQESPVRDEPFISTDYIIELRCGMDTCVKGFRARQKCIQQVLLFWEKGNLLEALRYISQLPNGKREAVVVDVFRATDVQALGIDLEACIILLPLIVELLSSTLEMYATRYRITGDLTKFTVYVCLGTLVLVLKLARDCSMHSVQS